MSRTCVTSAVNVLARFPRYADNPVHGTCGTTEPIPAGWAGPAAIGGGRWPPRRGSGRGCRDARDDRRRPRSPAASQPYLSVVARSHWSRPSRLTSADLDQRPRRRSGPGRCGDRPRRTRSCSRAIGSPSCAGSTEMRVSSYSSRAAASRRRLTRPLGRAADGEPERADRDGADPSRAGAARALRRRPAAPGRFACARIRGMARGLEDSLGAVGSGSGTVTATPRSWRSGSPGCPGRRPPSGPVSAC